MARATTVFVTGASGFIGSAVLHGLVEAGFVVRALVRPGSPRDHLPDHGVRLVEGDIRDRESIRSAITGARYVFHVAADYRLWSRDRNEIFTTNISGTRIVMEEALRAGVERVVYTSSVGTYKRSKIAAERLVLSMVADQGLPAVIVNPSTPVGPRDVRPTPTGRMILAAASGGIPAFVDTGLNLAHVDDVALGHLAALERGRVGERYILGGQNVPFRQMLHDIAAIIGRKGPKYRMPWYSALPVAFVAEAMAGVTGREPLATLEGVHLSKHRMFFCADKAERELGIKARPYQEGLLEAVRWFHDFGYCKAAPTD